MAQTQAQLVDFGTSLAISVPTNGLYLAAANTTAISANGVGRLFVNGSAGVGINTSTLSVPLTVQSDSGQASIRIVGRSADNTSYAEFTNSAQAVTYGFFRSGPTYLAAGIGATEALRVDSSGRLLVGTSTSRSLAGANQGTCQIETAGSYAVSSITTNSNDGNGAYLIFGKSRGTSLNSNTAVTDGDEIGGLYFAGANGSSLNYGASILCRIDGAVSGGGVGDMPSRLVFSTTADGASSPTERMRITNTGYLQVGDSGVPRHLIKSLTTSEGTTFLELQFGGGGGVAFQYSTSGNANGAATQMVAGRNSSTLRSINAGGTINASGADYAEYMVKAGDFDIAKGSVCGITADGLLTLDYADAVSFVVKSTNPSYVGGDTWGSEDVVGPKPDAEDVDALAQWETDLEAARQQVDRIAFAGQVPVNVMGATPGQYIVPVEAADGGIEGIAKNEADLTLAEYMRAVGKVIAIEDDGRARIIVKVA